MRSQWLVHAGIPICLAVLLLSCGGDSSSGPDTSSCPNWNSGDTMTYLRTETVSFVTSKTTITYTGNDRTNDLVTIMARPIISKEFAIVAGSYIP